MILIKELFSITLLFLSHLILNNSSQPPFQIPNIQNPQQVIAHSSEYFIIVDDEKVYKYYFEKNLLEEIAERDRNELIGIDDNGKIIYCRFVHRVISSPEEYSTTFYILNAEKEILSELNYFETIRPTKLESNTLLATTALDFLEEHNYEIDINSGVRKETEAFETEIKRYFHSKLDIKKVHIYNNRILIIDKEGSLYAL